MSAWEYLSKNSWFWAEGRDRGKPEWAVWWHGNTVVGSRSSFRAEGSKRGRVPAYVFRGGAKGAEGAWRSRVSGNI